MSVAAEAPPILQLVPIASSALRSLFSIVNHVLFFLFSLLTSPLLKLISVLVPLTLLILAPFITLIQVFLDAFVFTPYAIITALFDIFFPVYVFLGAAIVLAAIIGVGGRFLVSALLRLIFGPPYGDGTALQPVTPVEGISHTVEKPAIRKRRRDRFT